MIFIVCNVSRSYATITHIYLGNLSTVEFYYLCAGVHDTIIFHKPAMAVNNITWLTPSNTWIYAQDSVIATYATQGDWLFSSNETGNDFYVYFTTAQPVKPACMARDTSLLCTASINWILNAQNTGIYATYLWDNGVVSKNRTVTAFGTYWVTISNPCGTRTDTLHIRKINPNAPHLGADQSLCYGNNTVLTTGSTNVTSYQWSTGATTPTVIVDTTGAYWVYVQNTNGCDGRDTVNITVLLPITGSICSVGFDSVSLKNNINWPGNLPPNADSVKIYKETSLNVWTCIGTVSKTVNNFIDVTSNPQNQSNNYKITVIDTCGNESALSSYHSTIVLSDIYDAGTNTYDFTWSPYYGVTVSDYYLFGIDASNTVSQIASVSGNVYTYNYANPNASYVKYYIGFQGPNCNTSNAMVESNRVDAELTTYVQKVEDIKYDVYPNPATDQIIITMGAFDFKVEVLTMLGQVLLSEHNAKTLDVSVLNKGTYIMSITAHGVQTNKVIIKN